MKKLLFFALVAILFTACKDDSFKYDPSKMIAITESKPVAKSSAQFVMSVNPQHLTALEIVQQTSAISCWNNEFSTTSCLNRGFGDWQRDFTTPALKMLGSDIIDQYGKYATGFIDSYDIIYIKVTFDKPTSTNRIDTLAYTPNAVIIAARTKIKAAYDKGDYDAVYSLFNTAFTFTPITGAEWLALKKLKQN